MSEFNYLIEKLRDAEFISYPFDHLEIENFLSEEHFNIINSDSQIHFEEQKSHNELRNKLRENLYKPISFPGCTTDEDEYYDMLNNGNISSVKSGVKGADTEGVGIAYNLTEIRNSFIKKLIEFLNSSVFEDALRNKFEIEITILSTCDVLNIPIHQFKFYRDRSVSTLNDFKYPFQVVPTIKEAINQFVKENKPKVLLFSPSDESKARIALYKYKQCARFM
jgi:hypothetical protein